MKTTTTDLSSSSSNATRASPRGELGVRRTRPPACDLATLAELCQRAAGQSAPEAGKDGRRHDSLRRPLYTLKRPEPGTDARAPAGTDGTPGTALPSEMVPRGRNRTTDTGIFSTRVYPSCPYIASRPDAAVMVASERCATQSDSTPGGLRTRSSSLGIPPFFTPRVVRPL